MKKTAAILLLSLMVFNTTGYRLIVQWMMQQQNSRFNQQLDAANYEEASLVEVTVPLSLPYYNNWGDWERYDGEIQLNGQTFRYVKRKIEDGQLVLKCLPNPQQQIIQTAVSNAFAQLNGLVSSERRSMKSVKQFIKANSFEYEETVSFNLKYVITIQAEKPPLSSSGSLSFILCPSPWHPPETIS